MALVLGYSATFRQEFIKTLARFSGELNFDVFIIILFLSSSGTKRDVMLWCDGTKQDSPGLDVGSKRTSPSSNPPSKRRQIEDKVDETVDELRERHGTKYTLPQMRLWAWMVTADHHKSLDNPPDIPAITGIVPKRKKPRESVAEASSSLAGALRGTPTDATNTTPDSRPSVRYSPGKASEKGTSTRAGICRAESPSGCCYV